MREVFQQELREVQERLVEIAGFVAVSIENATRAFNDSNVSLAETVIADDEKIDAAALELDELAIDILARQQPVARDLRIVVSALRISASLERMGDKAEHIAQLARYRFPDKVVPKSLRSTFAELGALDVAIAQKLVELLKTEEVIADDSIIDEKAAALDELAIEILARQQPVARDLRIVVSALRISASLERMGDMAGHIAQLARYRFPDKVVPKGLRPTFRRLGELDVEIAGMLVELLRTQDMSIAEQIRNEDDKVDALHLSVFDKVLGETWKGAAVDTVDATLASRYHERFADHAVAIAKKVQYLSTGDWVPTDED